MPADIKPKLQFMNVPVSGDRAHENSPLRFLKDVARPEDFVAIKVDIDNNEIEKQIMGPMLDDENMRSLVDEVFFEYHFQSAWMRTVGWGDTQESSLKGALTWFQAFRHAGIRIHFWP